MNEGLGLFIAYILLAIFFVLTGLSKRAQEEDYAFWFLVATAMIIFVPVVGRVLGVF